MKQSAITFLADNNEIDKYYKSLNNDEYKVK